MAERSERLPSNDPIEADDRRVLPFPTQRIPSQSNPTEDDFVLVDEDLLEPGTMLGSYRIIERIGEGGVGYVYLADHVKLGRQVALKKLRAEFAHNPMVVSRFFAEAKAANRILHDNIVEVTDFVDDETNGGYIIMEHLVGLDLEELLHREGPPPIERSLRIMQQVASALGSAHRAGIVHRDLKPDNIFLTKRVGIDDFVKILDFGIAKLSETEENAFKTKVGQLLGTPAYMSPEQALGRTVDYRSDLYSFGVILYQLVTGSVPFDGTTHGELVIQHTSSTPRRVRSVPELVDGVPILLEELIHECLAKKPVERPPSMADVERRIVDLLNEPTQELVTYEAEVIPPPVRSEKSSPLPWIGGGGVLAFAAIAAIAVVYVATQNATPPSTVAQAPAPPPIIESTPEELESFAVPEPPPPLPTTSLVSFVTRPEGAEVWRADDDEALGVTPCDLEFERSDEPVEIELRLEGHRVDTQSVTPDRDARVSVSLRPMRRSRTRRGSTARGRTNRRTGGRRDVLEF